MELNHFILYLNCFVLISCLDVKLNVHQKNGWSINYTIINNTNSKDELFKAEKIFYSKCQCNYNTEVFFVSPEKNLINFTINTTDSKNGLSNITKETYIEGNSFSKGPYYSTGSKSVSLVKNGSYITLLGSWIVVPNTKSYDVIAVRLSGVSLDGSYSFKQSYIYGGNYNVIYNGNNQSFSNGFGSSAKLQNGTNQEYSLTFKVSGSGTVYGSYQHAVSSVTLNQSKDYTISSSGFGGVINFSSSVSGYYDGMTGVNLSV